MSTTLSGGCLCGAVRFTATPANREVGVCHCGMCRKWSAGPFLVHRLHRHGEGRECRRTSASIARRNGPNAASASKCGTPLFYRLIEKNMYFVSAEAFDDRSGYALTSQIFIDEKPAYYDFANKTHNMTGAEVFAAFAPPDCRAGERHSDVRHQPPQLHHQLRAAASGGARRAAPGAGARRRGGGAGRSAHRAVASRHRETDRGQDLSPGDPVFRPARLRRADEPGACVLSGGGEAAQARSAAPRATDPRAVLRDRAAACRISSTLRRRRWTSAHSPRRCGASRSARS